MHVQHDAADAVGRLYAGGADTLRAATRYGLSGRRKSNSMVAMTSVLSLITATSLLRRFRFDTRERAIHDVSHDAHRLNVCQECGETHEDCPRNTFGASHKNARQTVTVVGVESGLSMTSRAEITTWYAKADAKASKSHCGFDPTRPRRGGVDGAFGSP